MFPECMCCVWPRGVHVFLGQIGRHIFLGSHRKLANNRTEMGLFTVEVRSSLLRRPFPSPVDFMWPKIKD